jgi:hypothetical protein
MKISGTTNTSTTTTTTTNPNAFSLCLISFNPHQYQHHHQRLPGEKRDGVGLGHRRGKKWQKQFRLDTSRKRRTQRGGSETARPSAPGTSRGPAMKLSKNGCLRSSRVSTVCRTCGRRTTETHWQAGEKGFYCPSCCPRCCPQCGVGRPETGRQIVIAEGKEN